MAAPAHVNLPAIEQRVQRRAPVILTHEPTGGYRVAILAASDGLGGFIADSIRSLSLEHRCKPDDGRGWWISAEGAHKLSHSLPAIADALDTLEMH